MLYERNIIVVIALQITHAEMAKLFTTESKESLVRFSGDECYILENYDRKSINDIADRHVGMLNVIADDFFGEIYDRCTKELSVSLKDGIRAPGTKWCGQGSDAKDYWDLGANIQEDMCCREHDHCPKFLGRRECILGVCNNSTFTRSHCSCDEKFRRCLEECGTPLADVIGGIYFNVLQVKCFREDDAFNGLDTGLVSRSHPEETSAIKFEDNLAYNSRSLRILGFNKKFNSLKWFLNSLGIKRRRRALQMFI